MKTKTRNKTVDLLHPPKEWFSKPDELKPGMGTTITDDGRVFGYLALFNARYINGGRGNTKPPKSRSGYRYANSFSTQCEDGCEVTTGVIAGQGGHHHSSSFDATQAAYADTANLLARVKYGEDRHGIWFSGAVWPDADKAAIETLRSCGVSGHWERPRPSAGLELLGSCTVNIPGFAQHRLCAAATPHGGIILEPAPDSSSGTDESHTQHHPTNGSGLNPFKEGKVIPGGLAAGGGGLVAAGGVLQPISGILAVLDSPTIDGRLIRNVAWQTLPLPLMYSGHQDWGHMGAKNVGSITEITVDGSMVKFEGFVDSALEAAAEAEIIGSLGVLGISIDAFPEGDVEVIWGEDGWPESFEFEMMNIIGATLTVLPAFQETRPVAIQSGEADVPASGEVDNEQEVRAQDGEEISAGAEAESEQTSTQGQETFAMQFAIHEEINGAIDLLDSAAKLLEADETDEDSVLELILEAKELLKSIDKDGEAESDGDDEGLEASASNDNASSQNLARTTIRPPIVWH